MINLKQQFIKFTARVTSSHRCPLRTVRGWSPFRHRHRRIQTRYARWNALALPFLSSFVWVFVCTRWMWDRRNKMSLIPLLYDDPTTLKCDRLFICLHYELPGTNELYIPSRVSRQPSVGPFRSLHPSKKGEVVTTTVTSLKADVTAETESAQRCRPQVTLVSS